MRRTRKIRARAPGRRVPKMNVKQKPITDPNVWKNVWKKEAKGLQMVCRKPVLAAGKTDAQGSFIVTVNMI